MNISHYGKSIVYIALAAVAFLTTALTDNALSVEEILNLVVVVLGAIGVYWVPNAPENLAKYAKTGVAFLTAAVVAALSFLTDGITTSEWLQIVVAAFAAVGVFIVPNEPLKNIVQKVEVVSAPTLEPAHPTVVVNAIDPETAATAVAEAVRMSESDGDYHGR